MDYCKSFVIALLNLLLTNAVNGCSRSGIQEKECSNLNYDYLKGPKAKDATGVAAENLFIEQKCYQSNAAGTIKKIVSSGVDVCKQTNKSNAICKSVLTNDFVRQRLQMEPDYNWKGNVECEQKSISFYQLTEPYFDVIAGCKPVKSMLPCRAIGVLNKGQKKIFWVMYGVNGHYAYLSEKLNDSFKILYHLKLKYYTGKELQRMIN